jgi:hypothetical protein
MSDFYANKITHLYPNAIELEDFILIATNGIHSISYWNTAKLGAQPTLVNIDSQISDDKIIYEWEWKRIRKERNQLLKDSDYTMLKDYPTTVSEQEWTTYRQALRDIPQTFSNPDDVTYPDKPE